MPLPRKAPPAAQRHGRAPQSDEVSALLLVASAVWSQYFPSDHHIGVQRPDDTRETSNFSLVSESEGRFQAANAFRACFRNEAQWQPLIERVSVLASSDTFV
ncbi:hypothetical protein PINS_up009975 [Pythium insidiosum]|nr:hypothetical protein PINS_up009975 [Pythium insidiosum]